MPAQLASSASANLSAARAQSLVNQAEQMIGSSAIPPAGIGGSAALPAGIGGSAALPADVAAAKEVRRAFDQFVGEAFFAQMIKAMRTSVGKPAYFHGGRAEEVFQGQLDERLAHELSNASAKQLTDPMFRQQFPRMAEVLQQYKQQQQRQPEHTVDLAG